MKSTAFICTAAALFAIGLPGSVAHAIPRTFVSGTGSGTTCTPAAPCATFQAAHDATDANGEINCLDAGTFGTVTIAKSITIDCAGTLGSISPAGNGNAISINTAGVTVRLRNLTIDGLGGGGQGVRFLNGAALHVENCVITNFNALGGGGIAFFPPDGVTARLFVADSVISRNSSHGILVEPLGTGVARAVIDGVRLERNANGILALGTNGTGLAIVHVRNTVATGNFDGVRATTSAAGAILSLTVDRSSSTLSQSHGVEADGARAFVLLGRTTVISNTTGLTAATGGAILSYQNNHLSGNAIDGAPTALLTLR